MRDVPFPSGVSASAGPVRPDFLRDELLHEFFWTTAARQPAQLALRWREERMSYGELLRRAHQTAHYLRELGVRRGERVVVWMARGLDMYAAMLGILETGAAYVPLDPDYPTERVALVAADCSARLSHHLRRARPTVRDLSVSNRGL